MKSASFTDFRNNAKEYFDAVEKGETVEILRHGKPIALLTPVKGKGLSPRWKTSNPIYIPGVSASDMIIEERRKSRS